MEIGSCPPAGRSADQVLELLDDRPTPITAQDLFAELRARGARTGLATVYRALHTLQRQGAVHPIRQAEELAYRACTETPHDHLVCERCGVVSELPHSTLADWVEHTAPGGFVVADAPQQISGTCATCRRTGVER